MRTRERKASDVISEIDDALYRTERYNVKHKYVTFGRGRSQRLKDFDYSTPGNPFYVTVCTHNNQRILNNSILSRYVLTTMEEIINGYKLCAYILCIMPTHYHFLFELKEISNVSLFNVMKSINGKTGLFGHKIFKKKIWQRGYYDHVVRKDEDVIEIAKYISLNPKRWKERGKYKKGDRFIIKWFVDV